MRGRLAHGVLRHGQIRQGVVGHRLALKRCANEPSAVFMIRDSGSVKLRCAVRSASPGLPLCVRLV